MFLSFQSFLATGDSYKSIAYSYRVGHATVSLIVAETCEAIWDAMQSIYMKTPTEGHWLATARGFEERWNFPNCIGAIDGKHVVMQAPAGSGSQYFNYKGSFSVVLMALVDHLYRFIAIDVGSYGRNSDGGIFSHSILGRALQERKLSVPDDKPIPGLPGAMPHVIVGDEAFPLKTYFPLKTLPWQEVTRS